MPVHVERLNVQTLASRYSSRYDTIQYNTKKSGKGGGSNEQPSQFSQWYAYNILNLILKGKYDSK